MSDDRSEMTDERSSMSDESIIDDPMSDPDEK
jgi:hypothetical protein